MNRVVPIALLLICFYLPCYAQQDTSMRSMAVSQLCQYGQVVYDRGDYPEAAKIFNRILAMDPDNAAAINYAQMLNKKGHVVVVPPRPVPVPKPVVVDVALKAEVVKVDPPKTAAPKVEATDTDDLKQAIQNADAGIEKLQTEVSDLRAQIKDNQ